MFTGLIEVRRSPPITLSELTPSPQHIGTVISLQPHDSSSSGGGGTSLTIGDCSSILDDCALGDSICVNGACLTVTEFGKEHGGWFKVGLAPETLDRTDLGAYIRGEEWRRGVAVLRLCCFVGRR